MGGGSYSFENIPDLVESGKLGVDLVDTAVSRLLRAKFEMGLFENPYLGAPANQTSSLIHTLENVALARQLDSESIVLLENYDQTLPLSKTANIAVIGPMAHGYMNVSRSLIPPNSTYNHLVRRLCCQWKSISWSDTSGRHQICWKWIYYVCPRMRAMVQRSIRIRGSCGCCFSCRCSCGSRGDLVCKYCPI